MNISIVDNEEGARTKLIECLNYYSSKYSQIFTIREFSSGGEFLLKYENSCDIVFLDIEMDGINGLDVARQLRKIDKAVVIIFVTNIAQYAINGYEVEALDYIVKPIDKYSFAMKMHRAVAHASSLTKDTLQLNLGSDIVLIKIGTIKYIETNGHYIIYHTTNGDYKEYNTLKNVIEKMNCNNFFSISRFFYVNFKYIDAVKKDTIIIDKEILQISKHLKKEFLMNFASFISAGGIK